MSNKFSLANTKYNFTDKNLNNIITKIKIYDDNGSEKYYIEKEDVGGILSSCFDHKEMMWLVDSGLLAAPASKRFHGNYPGGLFIHSLVVGLELENLTQNLNLKWDYKKSALRIGILHDFCKTDDYIYPNINFKPNDDIQIQSNDNMDYNGHGDKSIILLSGHIFLTEQEKLCIRYHMGSFADKSEWTFYTRACQKEPNVLYTHMADMIASQIRGV